MESVIESTIEESKLIKQPEPPKITHCTVLQDNLLEALKIVAPFAAKRATLPVLTHANLVAAQGRLAVSATDLEQYALCYIGAQMPDEDFALAMPIKAFSEVVGMLNGVVNLSVNHRVSKMTVSSQILTEKKSKKTIKQENTLLGIDSAEFPVLPDCSTTVARFDGIALKRIIERCLFAAANDESRPILTTLCFTVKENGIVVAAADGFRLSVDIMLAYVQRPGTYLIPGSLFNDLYKHIKDDDEVTMRAMMKPVKHTKDGVDTYIDEPQAVEFATDNLVMGSQIVEGRYPDYNAIIPQITPVTATVHRKEMLAALKAALVFLKSGDYKGGTLSIRANQRNILAIESSDADLGNSRCEVEVAPLIGYNVCASFNLKYLQDGLNACRGDLVTIQFQEFNGSKHARPIKIIEGDFTHVIMPMVGHFDTYVHLEQPEYADMNTDQLAQVAGRFVVEGEDDEYDNLLAAIEACEAAAAEKHTVLHVLSFPDHCPVWEIDGHHSLADTVK